MDAMQYEALRRAQEMHSHAQKGQHSVGQPPSRGSQSNPNTASQRGSEPISEQRSGHQQSTQFPQTPPMPPTPTANSSKTQTGTVSDRSLDLNTLFEDKEKLLILLLILILSTEENSDPTLILALLYLII